MNTATSGTIAVCHSLETATDGTTAVCHSLPHVEAQKTMQWQSLQQYQLQSRWLLASYRQSSADKWQDSIIIVDLVIMAIGKIALLLLLSNFTLVTNITNTDVSYLFQ